MIKHVLFAVLFAALSTSFACAPRATRGGEGTGNRQMDAPAMSTGLDKADIDYLVSRNLDGLFESRFWKSDIEGKPDQPIFAIWPIENATTEHIDDQMLQLLSSVETSLINSGEVQIVAKSRQSALAREIGVQQGDIFDPASAAQIGRQLGAKFFVTGKLTAVDERLQNTRRVQYALFLQVLEIETGLIKFQFETARSKALQN
jgi:hypothetical protein